MTVIKSGSINYYDERGRPVRVYSETAVIEFNSISRGRVKRLKGSQRWYLRDGREVTPSPDGSMVVAETGERLLLSDR